MDHQSKRLVVRVFFAVCAGRDTIDLTKLSGKVAGIRAVYVIGDLADASLCGSEKKRRMEHFLLGDDLGKGEAGLCLDIAAKIGCGISEFFC